MTCEGGRSLWNQESTEELIGLYESMPELWDVDSPHYRDRQKKSAATASLAARFNTTEAEINRKIHNLRNQMSQEVRKLRSPKNGEGIETRYQGRWPFFERLRFILPALVARSQASINNGNKNNQDYDVRKVEVSQDSEESGVFYTGDAVEVELRQDSAQCTMPLPDVNADQNNSPPLLQNGSSNQSWTSQPKVEVKPRIKRPLSPLPQHQSGGKRRHDDNDDDDDIILGRYLATELRALRSQAIRRKLRRTVQRAILEACQEDDEEAAANGVWYQSQGMMAICHVPADQQAF